MKNSKKEQLDSIFSSFSHELDHFQKYSIEATIQGYHSLVTAHTGSGKSVCFEFAIEHFCKKGKKVIYTSPIKSLSNQKFNELTVKFPDITFGIFTGDIKFNPEADCIIMTTEILRNILLREDNDGDGETHMNSIDFTMNIQRDLACVIFDEVHYINDLSRGHVWEECILFMPNHVQMVMLSATMNRPEKFAYWVEQQTKREVWLSGTNNRVVPLEHLIYFTIPSSEINPKLYDVFPCEKYVDKLLLIKSRKNPYQERVMDKFNKFRHYTEKNHIIVNHTFILNNLVNTLYVQNKLPAICFVFSRKKCELYAKCIRTNLHEDKKKTAEVRGVCEKILRKHLSNSSEYMKTREFNQMIPLLEKGIGIHHSGILPVLRELIELLFEQGYIRLLFATETFSVGLNMPTKTVIFTSIYKFDGQHNRLLLPHEYTQMAGRAGRRGLDSIGHIVHLPQMFQKTEHAKYKHMLSGNAQTISSKFYMNYRMCLQLLSKYKDTEKGKSIDRIQETMSDIVEKSFYHMTHLEQQVVAKKKLYETDKQLNELKSNTILFTDNNEPNQPVYDYVKRILDLEYIVSNEYIKQKNKTKICNEIKQLQEKISYYSNVECVKKNYKQIQHLEGELIQNITEHNFFVQKNNDNILSIIELLLSDNCIELDDVTEQKGLESYRLTDRGFLVSCIQECNPLIIGNLYVHGYLKELSVVDLIMLFSCFSDIRIPEDERLYSYKGKRNSLNTTLKYFETTMVYYEQLEIDKIGFVLRTEDYNFQYDILYEIEEWCNVKDEISSMQILSKLHEKNIYTGEFVKACLKIIAIAQELEIFTETYRDENLKFKLHQIPSYLMKFVVTNQSLYV